MDRQYSGIFEKLSFSQKLSFFKRSAKTQFFVKNSVFSNVLSKTQFFVKNSVFCQKLSIFKRSE